MSLFGRKLSADKLAELAAKTKPKRPATMPGGLGKQWGNYVIMVTTSDGRRAQAWGGYAPGNNVRKMAETLAYEAMGERIRDVSKLWDLGLDDHARIQEITIETGPDLNNPAAP
jgi:hypothetical protein